MTLTSHILIELDATIDTAPSGDLVVAMVYRISRVWEELSRRQERSIVQALPLRPLNGLPQADETIQPAPAD